MNVNLNALSGNPVVVFGVGTVVLALLALSVRSLMRTAKGTKKPPAAVIMAGIAAALCTVYSADISWRFAGDTLEMTNEIERGAMFFVAEFALFSVANMARHNNNEHGTPGIPGTLVWLITGVQVIPAFVLYDGAPAYLRAFFGPICAALLWHLAMGIELKHLKPGEDSQAIFSVLMRELKKRFLSYLGIASQDRTAVQMTQDRAMRRAVRLASRGKLRSFGQSRLAAAVAKSGAADDPEQKRRLKLHLAMRRGATDLATLTLQNPWADETPATLPVAPVQHRVAADPDVFDQYLPPRVSPVAAPVPALQSPPAATASATLPRQPATPDETPAPSAATPDATQEEPTFQAVSTWSVRDVASRAKTTDATVRTWVHRGRGGKKLSPVSAEKPLKFDPATVEGFLTAGTAN